MCLVFVVLLFKEFELVSFDPDFASVQGWPTLMIDLLMIGALAIVTIVGLPLCGVILMAALIILPSAAARFWTNRLGRLLVLAAIAGGVAGIVGTFFASPLPTQWFGRELLDTSKLPPGPLIVLSATAIFLVSLLFAPQRGLIARTVAEIRLRLRIGREHLLRGLYELSESQLPNPPYIEESQLVARRSWSEWMVRWWLARLESRRLIERDGSRVRLARVLAWPQPPK